MTRASTAGGARGAPSVLVVSGEASGDRIAAGVARHLRAAGVHCFGMGGGACDAAGVALVADLRRSTAMGLTEVAPRLPAVIAAFARLLVAARRARPHAAVLVDYTEFNLRLGAALRRRGIPVLWCVAPQVWAWRPGRIARIARSLDRLAVVLPFEESLWRDAGVDAHYVGHPALDSSIAPSEAARNAASRPAAPIAAREPTAPRVALLPGSRAHEVRRHAEPMLAAIGELDRAGQRVEACLFASASLDVATRRWLVEKARQRGIAVIDVDPATGAAPFLQGFDASLVASGTATLECALAGATPVIVYRMSPLTAAVARRLVRTPHVGLPNVVLGAAVYPELLGGDVVHGRLATALGRVLEHLSVFEPRAEELRAMLAWRAPSRPSATAPRGDTVAERVTSLLSPWIDLSPRDARDRTDANDANDATDRTALSSERTSLHA